MKVAIRHIYEVIR